MKHSLAQLLPFVLAIVTGCGLAGQGDVVRSGGPVGPLATPATEITTVRVFELALGAEAPGRNPDLDGPELRTAVINVAGTAERALPILRERFGGGPFSVIAIRATAGSIIRMPARSIQRLWIAGDPRLAIARP